MGSSLILLGIGWLLIASTLAIPPNRIIAGSHPNLADGSTSPFPSNIRSMILANLELNHSITAPPPPSDPTDFWHIECSPDAIPPGWVAPPGFRQVDDLIDCHRALFAVTSGGGDPLEPQVWTARADWSYRSCGVFLTPARIPARINFPRIDIFEIAQEVLRKCVHGGTGARGGWVAIGGYFIVLVTGTGTV